MKLMCLRCGYGSPESGINWYQRGINLPKTCPNCKSLKWQKLKLIHERGAKRKKVPGDHRGIFGHLYK